MFNKILDLIFGPAVKTRNLEYRSSELEPKTICDPLPKIISIEADNKIMSKIIFDWDLKFPVSGDEISCQRFKEIVNTGLYTGRRADSSNPSLLELISKGSIKLEQLIEFQEKVKGKYEKKGRKTLITDNTFDELPYGTLSSLISGDPKSHLNAYLIAVNNYMMQKYHIARYLDTDLKEGTIRASSNSAKRCLEDNGRKIKLSLENLPIPHYLGCNCSIRPIIKF